jgi:hypothetical protein
LTAGGGAQKPWAPPAEPVPWGPDIPWAPEIPYEPDIPEGPYDPHIPYDPYFPPAPHNSVSINAFCATSVDRSDAPSPVASRTTV